MNNTFNPNGILKKTELIASLRITGVNQMAKWTSMLNMQQKLKLRWRLGGSEG